MLGEPSVSVIMPVYNSERYVAEAVESILGQTLEDFELLIVDDGSTDRTPEILRGYARRDERIRLVHRPHSGYVQALIEMLARARGKFLARMDADDVALVGRFARQVEFLEANPGHVAVGSAILLIDSDGDPIWSPPCLYDHDAIDGSMMLGNSGVIMHPAAMFRRSIVEAIGGYQPRYQVAEDYDLFLRLAERGKLANLPEVLLKYRIHPESVSSTRRSLQVEEMDAIVRDTYRRRGIGFPETITSRDEARPPRHQVHQAWAWMALASGHGASARKNVRLSARLAPLSFQSWKDLLMIYLKTGPLI